MPEPTCWLGSLEVDQRQRFIFQSDRLKEMVGASELIARTVDFAGDAAREFGLDVVWPVSGVVRLSGPDLHALSEALWQLRERCLYELGLAVTISVVPVVSANWPAALAQAELAARLRKDNPQGVDGTPAHPLFAQCSIQPEFPANRWTPQRRSDERRLVSHLSHIRAQVADRCYTGRFQAFGLPPNCEIPHNQENLVLSHSGDSYVALIKADADDVGKLLLSLPASTPQQLRDFALALNRCIEDACRQAARDTLRSRPFEVFPFLPLVNAGEDIWVLCARDLALPFALNLSSRFAELTAADPGLRPALDAAHLPNLTLSVAILFSKQGYPMDARLHLAEQLLANAKRFRRQQLSQDPRTPACLDYFWLESSSRHSIRDARPLIHDQRDFRLHTRPWTLTQAANFRIAAQSLLPPSGGSGGIPRRKLNQLEDILRRGRLAELAYSAWRNSLTSQECTTLDDALSLVGVASPSHLWQFHQGADQSPLAELLELSEILRLPEPNHD